MIKKKHLIIWGLVSALIFGVTGFASGIAVMNNTEEKIMALFSEDVKEVRQGKLTGAFIAMQDDEVLSEVWEELCSDILRDISETESEIEWIE